MASLTDDFYCIVCQKHHLVELHLGTAQITFHRVYPIFLLENLVWE